MVSRHIAPRGIHDPRVLAAMLATPRERFVSPAQVAHAYDDAPLTIPEGQTISQPYIVALMSAALALEGHERVLEVGTGSGYGAAVLSHLAKEVHTIERHPELAAQAARCLAELGLDNVTVHTGDGSLGLPEFAPYGGIVVTASGPRVPEALLAQLATNAHLVMPVGGPMQVQRLLRLRKNAAGEISETDLGSVAFVPLVGENAWPSRAHD